MAIKRETLGSARTAAELFEALEAKARELDLYPPSQDLRNEWGPVYFNDHYDLRIDKHPGAQRFSLMLLHKLQPGDGVFGRLRRRPNPVPAPPSADPTDAK
jgi:hypothetical protein